MDETIIVSERVVLLHLVKRVPKQSMLTSNTERTTIKNGYLTRFSTLEELATTAVRTINIELV